MPDIILKFLSIENTAITIFDYSMSWLELVGTLAYLLSVWLIARKNMLTWPVGIFSVILYFFLFYQIRLYADALEQVYYLGASIYGWWYWKKEGVDNNEIQSGFSSRKSIILWAFCIFILTLVFTFLMMRIHLIFPLFFPEKASYPFTDTLTTIMSFAAMFLLARKRTESWVYWIIVDVIGIGLYFKKDVVFISLLYVFLLGFAIRGLILWTKQDMDSAKEGI